MFTANFIFTETNLDDEFFRLDALILQAAEDTVGYRGKENWISQDGKKRNSIYYWDNMAALKQFSRHPSHIEAKKRYTEWYGGFHVVITEVVKSYGDDAFAHITPNARKRQTP